MVDLEFRRVHATLSSYETVPLHTERLIVLVSQDVSPEFQMFHVGFVPLDVCTANLRHPF